jgi:hypothetical protein
MMVAVFSERIASHAMCDLVGGSGVCRKGLLPREKRWWVRLHEKGGKRHEMPTHHKLEQFLDEYLKAAGIRDEGKNPSSVPLPARPVC